MKKRILLLLLLSFIYQNTSSFWILASFYLNQKFIVENICINRFDLIPMCYGSCYLQSELSEDSDKKMELPLLKTKEIQPLFAQALIYNPYEAHLIPVDVEQYSTEVETFIPPHFICAVFQPPEWV
ncbi:hypothetical protein ACPDHL_11195 [Myroides sp. C15-4]|uniref:hypothetical protein n=1 Tax=Myroides sp. C15-4 TaxID=3400532 RepID=UPI003D2F813B